MTRTPNPTHMTTDSTSDRIVRFLTRPDLFARGAARVCQTAEALLWHAIEQPPLRWIFNAINRRRHARQLHRNLEVGPGNRRIPGFETINIVGARGVDYIADASGPLPFKADTYEVIYASHVLEHIPWYRVEATLHEWIRILKPGGQLEIWVPNGLEIARVFVESETTGVNRIAEDGWYRFNTKRDPCKWAAGRIFSYGDGSRKTVDPNWHHGLFSPRYLKCILEDAGLVDVGLIDRADVRGYDHGWINLGVRGRKVA